MVMFSIITVVLNNKHGLCKTLESVALQSDEDWELIIKDGGSHDGSRDVADRASESDPRISHICSPDHGIYDAMNVALERARGDYVLFMNSGDRFIDPEVLSRLAGNIGRYTAEIYYCNSIITLEGRLTYLRRARSSSYVFYGQPALHQSTIYRTQFHKMYPYLLDYCVSSDYATLANMVRHGARTVKLDLTVALFEVIGSSASFRNQKKSREEMARAQREILNIPEYIITVYTLRRLLTNLVLRFVRRVSMISGRLMRI